MDPKEEFKEKLEALLAEYPTIVLQTSPTIQIGEKEIPVNTKDVV